MPEISSPKRTLASARVSVKLLCLAVLILVSPSAWGQDDAVPAPVVPEPGQSSPSDPGPSDGTSTDPDTALAPSATVESAPASDESRTTSQVASFAATRLKDSPAVVTVISGEDIRATGARDLIDVLNLVPGYFTGLDTQGVVGPGFRGLWGHEGKILLMIDGKEMNELLYSSMQLGDEFPVELIERVEVVRGPGSVIYGGSAELSVINVVTRGLQGATDFMANATYGEMTDARQFGDGYGRRRITASGRYVVDEVPGLSMFASVSAGQGQRSVSTFVDNVGNSVSMEGQSSLNPTVIQAGIGYHDFQATFLYHQMATTYVTGVGAVAVPPTNPVSMNFNAYHGELVWTLRPNNQFEIVPRFNYTYQRPWWDTSSASDFYYNKSVQRVRGRVLGRWAALDHLQITAGGDAILDDAQVLSPTTGGFQTQFVHNNNGNSIAYQTYAGYLELFSDNPILSVSAGARYDHQSAVGGALVPRLVVLRSFGPVSLKGLFSLSFREPGVENLNLGQDNLRPERTRVFEFEGSVDLTTGQRVSANVFDFRIDSPIAFAPVPPTDAEAYINLGVQGTRGFEISYRARARTARLEANYSFYVPSISDNLPPYVVPGHSDQFLAAPAHKATLRATWRPLEQLSISPTVIVFGERFTRGPADANGNPTATAIPTQVLANLFLVTDNVMGTPGLSLGLGIYNILGVNYRYVHASATPDFASDHAPLPGLDREVLLRLTYAFDASTASRPRSSAPPPEPVAARRNLGSISDPIAIR
jgi:outer membrane receptor for ferrienterochelin and colicins